MADADGNKLILEVNEADFTASVSGFDPRRDVIVDARIEELSDA